MTISTLTRRSRGLAAAVSLGAATLAPIGLAHANPDQDWSQAVWDAARVGDQGQFERLLGDVPPTAASVTPSAELLLANYAKDEAYRAEKIEEVSGELDEHLEEAGQGELDDLLLSKALVTTIELQILMDDEERFFADPRVGRLMAAGVAAANNAESEGRWLIANELFYRLHQLTESSGEFKDDSDRLTNRLAMIRLYAPDRFHELRNERRALDGDDPLPAFNKIGQDFREKTRGINDYIVKKAIERAAQRYVDREKVELADLVASGLEQVKTMVTTTDLHKAFPDIANAGERTRFVAYLDGEITKLRQPSNRARFGRYDLSSSMSALSQMNRRTVRVLPEALLHEFGNGAMSVLDEYSAIIWPDELSRFRRSTQGRFVGVGIQIKNDEELNIEVVTPLEGAPAQRAGIRAGDVITEVNGESIAGLNPTQAADVITGPEGTEVELTVERQVKGKVVEDELDEDAERETEELTFTVQRANIKLPSVKGWKRELTAKEAWDWHIDPDQGIGYVRLTQFAPDTAEDFDAAINEMRNSDAGLKGLVLDLRFNPGGLLDQAVAISNRFVPEGLIVQTVDADGAVGERHTARPRRATLDGIPVVVLINEGSASASEIVSGAVRHYADQGQLDAMLIGDRTFGKGSVQNVWALSGNQTAQKLTTQYYTLPNGRIIHRKPGSAEWGVDPNLPVNMLTERTNDALILRMEADVVTLDEKGNVAETDADRPSPDDLIAEGTDLQLHTALVLLQSRTADAAHAALDKPVSPGGATQN